MIRSLHKHQQSERNAYQGSSLCLTAVANIQPVSWKTNAVMYQVGCQQNPSQRTQEYDTQHCHALVSSLQHCADPSIRSHGKTHPQRLQYPSVTEHAGPLVRRSRGKTTRTVAHTDSRHFNTEIADSNTVRGTGMGSSQQFRVVSKLQSGTGYKEKSAILGGIQTETGAPSETLSTVWDTR